jgi:hypothetical protein
VAWVLKRLGIAAHMRFIEADRLPWWILEMAGNRENRVLTKR